MNQVTAADVMAYQTTHDDCIARVEGGRLIELLPPSVDGLASELTEHNDSMAQLVKDYRIAFEADIINLLIGPLAEAKHIATIDNKLFNHKVSQPESIKKLWRQFRSCLGQRIFTKFLCR